MPSDLPEISFLQYLALGVLTGGPHPGRELRDAVRGFGVRRTRAAFYQFMARLEKAGWVEGWYEQVEAGGQTVTERRYRLTAEGRRVWDAARDFQRDVDRLAGAAPHG